MQFSTLREKVEINVKQQCHTTTMQPTLSEHIWSTQYRWAEDGHMQESGIEASWDRVALAVAAPETHHRDEWRERFRGILQDFRFLPGTCILANAGTSRRATLIDCFAASPIEDSIQGIFNALRETMMSLQAGSGVTIDFSTLRPAGTRALASGGLASGPISFMKIWEQAHTILDFGNLRRGSLVANLRCDHPDIEAFIETLTGKGALPHFKLAVAVTDDFMRAVEQDGPWPLVFPLSQHPVPVGGEVCERMSPNGEPAQLCLVHRRMPARALWDKLIEAQHSSGAIDILFLDRMNRTNNLWYCERIACASPYGEMPLPPNGGASLGSINLSRFVDDPFAAHPRIDMAGIKAAVAIATRFLDNVHDLSLYPHNPQGKAVRACRRIGLGVSGLADMLAMLGVRYGSKSSLDLTDEIMGMVRDTAYLTSIEIAREKGAFPEFDKIKYGASPFILNLSHNIQNDIAQHGIRNSHLLTVGRNESACLLGNNVSRGVEPILAVSGKRQVLGADGQTISFEAEDAAWSQFTTLHGPDTPRPQDFVEASDVSPEEQLHLLSTVQSCIDGAVTNIVHCPRNATPQELGLVLLQAWELGLTGCLAQREGCSADVTSDLTTQ